MQTVFVGDKKVKQVNVMDVPEGVTIHVRTTSSNWYFTRVVGSRLINGGSQVQGVSVVTDSKGYGQVMEGPFQMAIDATIEVGNPIELVGKWKGATGDVRSVTQVRS